MPHGISDSSRESPFLHGAAQFQSWSARVETESLSPESFTCLDGIRYEALHHGEEGLH